LWTAGNADDWQCRRLGKKQSGKKENPTSDFPKVFSIITAEQSEVNSSKQSILPTIIIRCQNKKGAGIAFRVIPVPLEVPDFSS